jgi:hypothetical protein
MASALFFTCRALLKRYIKQLTVQSNGEVVKKGLWICERFVAILLRCSGGGGGGVPYPGMGSKI